MLIGHLNISLALTERQKKKIAFQGGKDAKVDYANCFHLCVGIHFAF